MTPQKLRRSIIALFCCTLFFPVSVSAARDTYESSADGFRVQYPSGWIVEKHPTADIAVSFEPRGQDVSIGVLVSPVSEKTGKTLDAFSAGLLERLRTDITDFTLLTSQRGRLAGAPARAVTYSAKFDGKKGFVEQIWIVRKGTFYCLVLVSDQQHYGRARTSFRAAIRSFALLPQKKS